MPPKVNPKSLNPLQLRTLAIFQRLATLPHSMSQPDGSIALGPLPHPHGDHFHIGPAVILTRNATGLTNQGAWSALERKGLIRGDFPHTASLTRAGVDYPIGPISIFIEHSDH
jgi:hypothetical protein